MHANFLAADVDGEFLGAFAYFFGSYFYSIGQNIPQPFPINQFCRHRYHSLVIQPDTLHPDLIISAWSNTPEGDLEIMGVRHKSWSLFGVQFHPESFLTLCGIQILEKFLAVGQVAA